MKHIIIGGVAGGATAAARIRRTDEKAEIVLLEKGKYISYANCGLPYYIGGTIAEREKLFMQTPASFAKRFNIDVRVENEVIGIDTTKKRVEVRRADGSTYTENYDKMLLSPGASPVRPPLKGIEIEGIFTLRNIEDTDRIKEHLSSHRIGSTVIVGAGFIGLEMAENLHRTGAEVSVVEMGNQVMAPVDFSIAAHVHQHLSQKGIKLYLERSVERFERQGEKIEVFFSTGESITTDIVLLSIGVRPETTLAKAAGLKIGETGGIWVDDYLQTSATDVYAAGDAIEFPHPLTGKPWLNYLANPANRQGRIAADNMVFGNTTKYEGAIGTSIAKVFDMTVASTGLAAKRLKQSGIPYASSTTHSASHAGYYPDALPLTIKLTFDPASGKLYGGQCVGYEGVDKRIDQIALLDIALRFNPDIIAVGEMRGPEANAAQEAARVGVAVLTTIHSSSSEGTYRRMVSLCKRAVDTPDDTLMGYVTEAYPIVVYCRQLENKERRITNISECEILPDGSRRLHKLYEYNITENRLEGDRFIIEGHHQKCEEMSESLQRRFIENGMPRGELEQFIQRKEETA